MNNYQQFETDKNKLVQKVIWSDIDSSLSFDTRDGIKKALNIDAVRTSIDNILKTYPSERVMLPTFGSSLQMQVFELITSRNLKRFATDISEAINQWDNRVIVNSIDFKTNSDQSAVFLDMNFSVRGDDEIYGQRVTLPYGA